MQRPQDDSSLQKTFPKRLKQSLKRMDFPFLVVGTILVLPFVKSSATLDPTLTPRLILWASVLWLVSLSLAIQRFRKSPLAERCSQPPIMIVLFLGYVLPSGLSLVYAVNVGEGLPRLAILATSLVFLTVLITVLNRDKSYISKLIKSVTLSATALSCIGFYQYFKYGALYVSGHGILTGTMGNKNLFASALFLVLPFCLFMVLRGRRSWQIIASVTTASILVLIILSHTRAVWLALSVSSVLTIVVYRFTLGGYRSQSQSLSDGPLYRRFALLGLIFLVLGILFAFFYLRSHSIDQLVTATLTAESGKQRLSTWTKTLEMIRDHPLSGVGLGNWKIILPSYGVSGKLAETWSETTFIVRPHNDFLWTWSETGLFGLGLYLSIFCVTFYDIRRLLRQSKHFEDALLALLMLLGLIGYLIIAFFSFPSERVFHTLCLVIMIAIVTVLHQRHFGRKKPWRPRYANGTLIASILILSAILVLGCIRLKMETHTKRALAARASKDYPTVISEIDRAYSSLATLDLTATPLKWYRGEANYLLGNVSEACEDYEEALQAHPYHIHVLNNLATCLQLEGDRDRAIVYYERLLDIAPPFTEAACNLAAVHFNAGHYEQALAVLTRCDPNGENPLIERYTRIVTTQQRHQDQAITNVEQREQDNSSQSTTVPEDLVGVHRLWTASSGRFLYTIDDQERDRLLAGSDEAWTYEGIGFHAFKEASQPDLKPVHHFYNTKQKNHFYTLSPVEIAELTDKTTGHWRDRGVAFFAFAPDKHPAQALPVYRFWSAKLGYHLYTIDKQERDELRTTFSHTWHYEGAVCYVYR